MNLVVFSHKPCWPSATSPSGYASDGGFPMQMAALSELFNQTTLVVPVTDSAATAGEVPLTGHHLRIATLSLPAGEDFRRKLNLLPWLITNAPKLLKQVWQADAVHVPIPGDIGTLGMLLAFALRKPLCVRYCGNWFVSHTTAERLWKWFMERFAGGRNVMLATGGDIQPPSRNPSVRWIFSTSLTEQELQRTRRSRTLKPDGAFRLIIVCRQELGKGTDIIIQSLPLLAGQFPNLHLDVVGAGGGLAFFKQLAASLNLTDRVSFHGKVNHDGVLRLLDQADLFCYPTESEGFPKVVVEALACGLPVVTTNVSILPNLVGTGSGIVLDASNKVAPETLASAIRECLSDEARYQTMSATALATARQYSLERWRDTIGDLLRASWRKQLSDA